MLYGFSLGVVKALWEFLINVLFNSETQHPLHCVVRNFITRGKETCHNGKLCHSLLPFSSQSESRLPRNAGMLFRSLDHISQDARQAGCSEHTPNANTQESEASSLISTQ